MLMGMSIAIFVPVSYIIFGDIHEGGHALACLARGGHVGGFGGWLRGILPFANPPATNYSIKPIPAPVWAAGALTSIVSGSPARSLSSSCSMPPSLNRRFCAGPSGGCWSFWFLAELFNDIRHAYAPPSVWEDSTQFVRVTGVNPDFVGLPLAGVFVIALFIGGRILKRL
jgi:hypothetical protein